LPEAAIDRCEFREATFVFTISPIFDPFVFDSLASLERQSAAGLVLSGNYLPRSGKLSDKSGKGLENF